LITDIEREKALNDGIAAELKRAVEAFVEKN
jgi:hypothetical protein